MMELFLVSVSLMYLAASYRRIEKTSSPGVAAGGDHREKSAAGFGYSYTLGFGRGGTAVRASGIFISAEGLSWCLHYIYHYMVARMFWGEILLNLLNVMVAIMEFLVFCQRMYQRTDRCPGRMKIKADHILHQTRDCWEFILAGSVLTQLFLRLQ